MQVYYGYNKICEEATIKSKCYAIVCDAVTTLEQHLDNVFCCPARPYAYYLTVKE